jgi:Fe-S-cluster containining protein
MPRIFKIDLETRFGALRGGLPLPDAPIRLAEFAYQLFPLEERLVQQAIQAATEGGKAKISCGPKCGACCRQAVPISIPEAFLLRDLVLSMPQVRRGEILRRFEAIQIRLQHENLDIEMHAGENPHDRWMRVGLRYFSMGMACPFLEEESCSIHPYRPTVCREFLVTSPAQECQDPAAGTVVGMDNSISLPHCLARLTGILMEEEPQLIIMPMALDWVEEHMEWNEKRFDAGMLYSTLFDIIKDLAEVGNKPETGPASI